MRADAVFLESEQNIFRNSPCSGPTVSPGVVSAANDGNFGPYPSVNQARDDNQLSGPGFGCRFSSERAQTGLVLQRRDVWRSFNFGVPDVSSPVWQLESGASVDGRFSADVFFTPNRLDKPTFGTRDLSHASWALNSLLQSFSHCSQLDFANGTWFADYAAPGHSPAAFAISSASFSGSGSSFQCPSSASWSAAHHSPVFGAVARPHGQNRHMDLAAVAWSLAQFSCSSSPSFSATNAWSSAPFFGCITSPLHCAVGATFAGCSPQLNSQAIANVAWALAATTLLHGPMPQAIANAFWAFSEPGFQSAPMCQSMPIERSRELAVPGQAHFIWAFAALCAANSPLFSVFPHGLQAQCTANNVGNIAWALASISWVHAPNFAGIPAFAGDMRESSFPDNQLQAPSLELAFFANVGNTTVLDNEKAQRLPARKRRSNSAPASCRRAWKAQNISINSNAPISDGARQVAARDDDFAKLEVEVEPPGKYSPHDHRDCTIAKVSAKAWRKRCFRLPHCSLVPWSDGIPRIMHQIWIGPKEPPCLWMDTFRVDYMAANPGWQYWLWTDTEVESLPMLNRDIYDEEKDWQCKADILRLEILWRHGGLYLDADLISLEVRSFEPIVACGISTGFVIAYEPNTDGKPFPLLGNSTFACMKFHPLVLMLMQYLKVRYLRTRLELEVHQVTGPLMYTKCLIHSAMPVALADQELLYPCFHYIPDPDKIDFSAYPKSLVFQFGYTCTGLEDYVRRQNTCRCDNCPFHRKNQDAQ